MTFQYILGYYMYVILTRNTKIIQHEYNKFKTYIPGCIQYICLSYGTGFG
jgi:hypothetical protein